IYFLLARPVMEFFTDDRAVLDAGVNALHAISLSLPFWAIWSVNGGALRGLGDTRTPVVMSVITVWRAGGLGMVWLTFMFTSPLGAFGNWCVLRRRLRATREWAPEGPLPST